MNLNPVGDQLRAILEAELEVLFHSEFLATIAGIKPLSIVRAFDNASAKDAWTNGWNQELLSNSDLLWEIRIHETGPTLWIGSQKQLLKFLPNIYNCAQGTLAQHIEAVSKRFSTDRETHEFYGNLFGYPSSSVQNYSIRSREEREKSERVPLLPIQFQKQASSTFRTFEGDNSEEVRIFLSRIEQATERYQFLRGEGWSAVDIFNLWNENKTDRSG